MFVAENKKKSCVKEVELIKQRREERRAAQQALKEQQDLEYDTSIPNWEFDAMIKWACRFISIHQVTVSFTFI